MSVEPTAVALEIHSNSFQDLVESRESRATSAVTVRRDKPLRGCCHRDQSRTPRSSSRDSPLSVPACRCQPLRRRAQRDRSTKSDVVEHGELLSLVVVGATFIWRARLRWRHRILAACQSRRRCTRWRWTRTAPSQLPSQLPPVPAAPPIGR